MSEKTLFLFSLSILLPILVFWIRWQRSWRSYWPLMCLFLLGLVGEWLVWKAIQTNQSWLPFNNLYILADSLLIPIQFAVWGFIAFRNILFLIVLPLLLTWTWLHLISGSLADFVPYYRIAYSFLILLLGIYSINFLIVRSHQSLLTLPVFLITVGFLLFYAYQLLYESAYALAIRIDLYWSAWLNQCFALINFVCNIVYGIAGLRLPMDPLQYRKLV